MKKNLLVSLLFTIGLHSFSQPAVKIFAFEQENLPGTQPAGVKDENGNTVKKAAAKKNYFIFLSLKKSTNVTPVQLFIEGVAYSIRWAVVSRTPVEYTSKNIPNRPVKTTLVPKTRNKVIQITPTEISGSENHDAGIQKLARENDVVVVYKWNKKRYAVALNKIRQLEPVANE